jgi:hypothetical protein
MIEEVLATRSQEMTFSGNPAQITWAYAEPRIPQEAGIVTRANVDPDRTEITTLNGSSEAVNIKLNHLLESVPRLPQAKEFFLPIQKWEGCVTEVGKDTFWARLSTIFGEGDDQEAEIYLEEVDLEDRTLIKTGAVFYWTIGYLDRPSGRQRSSILRFRRLPVWTTQDLAKARSTGLAFRQLLNDE